MSDLSRLLLSFWPVILAGKKGRTNRTENNRRERELARMLIVGGRYETAGTITHRVRTLTRCVVTETCQPRCTTQRGAALLDGAPRPEKAPPLPGKSAPRRALPHRQTCNPQGSGTPHADTRGRPQDRARAPGHYRKLGQRVETPQQ